MMLDDLWRPSGDALGRTTRDLTADARAGRLEPVCCRDAEVSRVVDILLRQHKNNPVLVGAAGVGKTAIAEGLAQRIAAGAVPVALRSARILALDHVALLAGTMYRGQYEERIRAVVEAASADPDIVLFVDELHNLIGQGSAVGVAMDAANMLKPALARGEFRVIGATTDEEYTRWIRGDAALERRFQSVMVRELDGEQTMEILRARRDRLERHHAVVIADDALTASVRLTDLFVTDRRRPDRALDALDEACAHAQAHAELSPVAARLVNERRRLMREALNREEARGPRPEPNGNRTHAPEEDSLERFARDGFAVLERFGAELGAALSGEPRADVRAEPAAEKRADAARPVEQTPSAYGGDRSARLAVLDVELRRMLMEEGLVVRGHDVARVVSLATGQHIQWTD